MSRQETLLQLVLVWFAVYPSVTFPSHALGRIGLSAPLFPEILISTALTVPLSNFVVQPTIFRRVARMRGERPPEPMRRRAGEAPREGA